MVVIITPFFVPSIEDLYIALAHCFEHPGCSEPEEVFGSGVVNNDKIGWLDAQTFHVVVEILFTWDSWREFGVWVMELVNVQELSCGDVL